MPSLCPILKLSLLLSQLLLLQLLSSHTAIRIMRRPSRPFSKPLVVFLTAGTGVVVDGDKWWLVEALLEVVGCDNQHGGRKRFIN